MFRVAAVLAFLSVLCLPGHPGATAQDIRLRLAHTGESGSMQALAAQQFALMLMEETGGRVMVEVSGAGKLGNESFILQKVKDADLDLVLVTAIMSSVDDAFGAFELPYLILSREHVARVRDQLLAEHLVPAARKSGYEVLGLWDDGFRHITMTNRPIVSPRDFHDITLQVPQGEWRLRLFRSLGANATPQDNALKLSDARKLVQLGVVDGREMSLSQIEATQFHEVQRYLSLTRHVYAPIYLVAGSGKFAKLPPDVQAAIRKTAAALQDWTARVAAANEREIVERLRNRMAVNEIEDPLDFLVVSLPIYQEFSRLVPQGKELVKLLYDPTSFMMLSR